MVTKDTAEWLNWIAQGKRLCADKQKVQALIDQQRMTFADVKYLDLNRVNSILNSFKNPQADNSRSAVAIKVMMDGRGDSNRRSPNVSFTFISGVVSGPDV